MTDPKLQQLKARLAEIDDLKSAAAVLHWDQATYMPPGGAPAHARQMATLQRLAHEKFTDPAIGKLLDELRPYEESLPYDSDEASLIRVARRDYEKAVKVPPSFTAELENHSSETYIAWRKARPANDFASVRSRLGEDARPEPPACQLLPRLRARRRSVDRLLRSGHESRDRARAFCRVAARACADCAGDHRAAACRRCLSETDNFPKRSNWRSGRR